MFHVRSILIAILYRYRDITTDSLVSWERMSLRSAYVWFSHCSFCFAALHGCRQCISAAAISLLIRGLLCLHHFRWIASVHKTIRETKTKLTTLPLSANRYCFGVEGVYAFLQTQICIRNVKKIIIHFTLLIEILHFICLGIRNFI